MSHRLRVVGAAAALALFAGGLVEWARPDTPATNVGKRVDGFELKDPSGRTVRLANFKDRRAVVVVFIGTECPINNAYMPTLAALHREYGSRGVQFLAVNANCLDTAQQVAAHAKVHGLPFPVLRDEGNVVADRLGARRTPEAFVLDTGRVIRYQGRIDDRFGVGYQRPRPTRRDLAEALDEILAGKPVSRPTTPVAGCRIARVTRPRDGGPVTFSNRVARILQDHCQECHRAGQIGPMPLLTYEDATGWAETIREAVADRRMPPWHADPRHGKFSNDRRLPDADREALLAWLDNGTPRGDPRDLPPARAFVAGWRIGKPDVVIDMGRDFPVPAAMPKGGVPYQHFTVDPGFGEDRWVVRAEARAGAPDVVHHILVFILPPGKRFFPGDPDTPALAGIAPGDMPLMLPPSVGKKIPAGSKLVFQMHYTPNGKSRTDRSEVGLIFARARPPHEAVTVPVANPVFRIPPGADGYRVAATFPFERDGHLISFMPHMHLRGKSFRYEAVYPDGRREVLLDVPRFNFNWQSVYRLADPVAMPRGSRLVCTAVFDNSAKNPSNPDPTKAVTWGDQTWEEMMVGWMEMYDDRPTR